MPTSGLENGTSPLHGVIVVVVVVEFYFFLIKIIVVVRLPRPSRIAAEAHRYFPKVMILSR